MRKTLTAAACVGLLVTASAVSAQVSGGAAGEVTGRDGPHPDRTAGSATGAVGSTIDNAAGNRFTN